MKEIINDLAKIYNELKIRKTNNKIKFYNTGKVVHKKQVEFHKCTKRNRWVFGGNRTGKTECGAVEVVYLCRGIHPYKQNKKSVEGWVVSLSTQVQRDVAQRKILEYINPSWVQEIVMLEGKKSFPQSGVIDYIIIKNVLGGLSKIGFKSCDQGREKFQGTSLDFVWFDEEPPRDIYLECKMRVLDKCGEIFGTMTPLKGLTWVYDEIYLNNSGDSEVWYNQLSWQDNPFLSPQEIKHFEGVLTPEELESRKFGRFTGSEGLVYKEFDENVNVIQPFNVPTEWYDNISIDPGLKNPLSAHWYAVDYDGNVFVIAEHFEAGKSIEYHSEKIKAICKRLNWHKSFNGNYSALIDSAANQKTLSSPKSVAELFLDFGLNVNTNVNKDLFSGITKVKRYLKAVDGTSKLFIFSTCTNLIREIKSYFWGNNDAPIKRDDHCLDELRYYIMSRPENHTKIQTELSIIEKHKNSLAKKCRIKKFLN